MKPTFPALTTVLLGTLLLSAPPASGETIVLKNGNKIDGSVISDERASGGKLVLGVAGGTMFFRASEIESIESAAAAAPAEPTGDFVEVRLAKGSTFYGTGSYFGRVSPQSNDVNLVLAIPDVGTITIPRSAVASINQIAATSPELIATGLAPGQDEKPSEIATTHAVYMKNGRKLIGSVIPTPAEEPVKVRIGHLGVLTVARKDIVRIAEEAGTVTLPAEETRTEVEATPEPGATPLPNDLETLKERIKAELLRELLQELLDVKVGVLLEKEAAPAQLATTRMTIFGEEEVSVQELIAELGRNRAEYRTRAESRLREMGPPVLPWIESLVHHPFDLTRRAVQRIARDIAAWESVPIAIEGLNDPDQFVREIAHETLTSLLPDAGVSYHPNDSRRKREEAQAAYWGVWDEEQLYDARRKVLDRLTNAEVSPETSPQKAPSKTPPSVFGTDSRASSTTAAGEWRAVPHFTHGARPSTSPSAGSWRPVPLTTHGIR